MFGIEDVPDPNPAEEPVRLAFRCTEMELDILTVVEIAEGRVMGFKMYSKNHPENPWQFQQSVYLDREDERVLLAWLLERNQ